MKVTRNHALAGIATLLAGGGKALGQGALTTVRVASNPVGDVIPLLYAQNSGLFRNLGLDVTLQKATSGSVVAAALVGNAIDIGKVSSVAIITAHSRGVGLAIIFPDRLHTYGPQAETALVVAPDSPIRTGRDLNGKTISVGAIKDSTWIGARLWIDSNGGDSTTVKFIELPFSAVAAAVQAGRIDAGTSNDPYLKQDVSSGKVRSLGDLLAAMGSKFLETAWVATTDYIAKNRDTTTRFVRAIRQAQVWLNGHTAEGVQLNAAFTGIDAAVVATTRAVFATESDPRVMQPYIAACAKYGIIPQTFNAAETVHDVAPGQSLVSCSCSKDQSSRSLRIIPVRNVGSAIPSSARRVSAPASLIKVSW
jgi:NitT/TauT family transport system substrate-binding protein